MVIALVIAAAVATTAGAAPPKKGSYAGIKTGNGTLSRLEIGMRLHQGSVDRAFWEGSFSSCASSGDIPDTDALDSQRRFKLTASGMDYENVLHGRFVSRREVRGTIKHVSTNSMACPGTYKTHFVARNFGGTSGHSSNPRDGSYAGTSKNAYLWFQVEQGQLGIGSYVHAFFSTCTQSFYIASGAPIDSHGLFQVEGLGANDDVVLKGRFTKPKTATGSVNWSTTSNCPAGSTGFPFAAGRLGG